jgi:Tetratricopeptide repeat
VTRRTALAGAAGLAVLLAAAAAFPQPRAAAAPPEPLTDAIARGDTAAALRLAGERAAAAERDGAGDPAGLASTLEALATQVSELAAPEAASFAEEQLRRSLELQQAAGRPPVEQLPTLGKLSELQFVAGRWQRAEELDRRCLTIALVAFGEGDPRVADARRNLSLSVFNQGRFRDAETLQREVVTALEGARPEQPLALALALGDLADNLRAQNRYRAATPLFERSVRLAEQAVGPSAPELVALLINLGGLYRDTNRYAESQWRLGQARQILEA